ncbi:MAGUK p55 subfamily member 3-like isoform X2 [Nerophis lumbriciformis]|uniref:MAGUK p55 subfamily member 3-like isoform X2 n=1 Tax=Nerophis lumbriciformis TaxID=546530 RepID=UPI002ADF7E51|nr:MAGUK p55 subfamily member 3-like isoform X2 [Nerophis lumbriciformis]
MTQRNMPVVSTITDLHETLALLTSQLHPDANHKEDLVFLKGVFSEKSLGYLMKVHDKLKQYEKQSPSPVLHSASCLAEDLTEELQDGPLEEDEKELLLLLSAPHLKAVLSAHDTVAQKNFDPVLPPLPDDVDDDLEEESVKIVRLVKNKEPLGATIRRDEVTGAVIVARIMRGGAADRSGLVHVGDELREVNGNLITHKRPDEISHILVEAMFHLQYRAWKDLLFLLFVFEQSQSQGSITLKIIPAIVEEDKMKESRVYLRALFDYVPFEDRATPCQEAGLPFKRGDILQVVSQEDATWWQAKKVGDCNLRAALIPSTHFQERRLRYRLKTGSFPASVYPKVTTYERAEQAGLRRSFRLKKERQSSPGDPRTPDATHSDFLIYEEVTLYVPRHGEKPRLIVLLGSLGARISELKQKVIAENSRLYGLAVPHTTRPRKSHEREGVEYHFITKAAFEADIHSGTFIEYGEYKDNLYGTSLESIHRILDQNKMCLVDVQPEALHILRTPALKPFVVFVRPSVFDSESKSLSSCSSLLSVAITEHDIQDMRQSAEKMEQSFGHWMDYILVKEELLSAVAELHVLLDRVRLEPQWVPLSWVRT